jgi:hypothetical protein
VTGLLEQRDDHGAEIATIASNKNPHCPPPGD